MRLHYLDNSAAPETTRPSQDRSLPPRSLRALLHTTQVSSICAWKSSSGRVIFLCQVVPPAPSLWWPSPRFHGKSIVILMAGLGPPPQAEFEGSPGGGANYSPGVAGPGPTSSLPGTQNDPIWTWKTSSSCSIIGLAEGLCVFWPLCDVPALRGWRLH